jgi:hypothetical protein
VRSNAGEAPFAIAGGAERTALGGAESGAGLTEGAEEHNVAT